MASGEGLDIRLLAKNAVIAFAAQGLSLFVSVVMSLVVPRVLGVASYGYWQLFVFYASYSGFFHFGLNDGIYLIEGGKNRKEIDKHRIVSSLYFEIFQQLIVAAGVLAGTFFLAPEPDRAFVLSAFAAYTVVCNLSGLLGYVFQAMNETKLFSFSSMVDRFTFLVLMLFFVILGVTDFKVYVISYILSRSCCLAYCCYHAKDFLSARPLHLKNSIYDAFLNMKIGCSLMFANIADMLVLGVARALVDSAWGIEVFGKVSLSLSLVNFFITFVSQAAMVLFPALRQGTNEDRRKFYKTVRDTIELAFPGVYLLYFPMVWLLSLWLPQYSDSLRYFAVLLPICVFDTKMSICCTTYFKVLREERTLLVVNLMTVAVSTLLSLLGVFVLKSLDFVLLGVVVSIVLRSLWSERYLNKKLNVAASSMTVEEVFLTAAFIGFVLCVPAAFAIVGFLTLYFIYLFMNRSTLNGVTANFKNILH